MFGILYLSLSGKNGNCSLLQNIKMHGKYVRMKYNTVGIDARLEQYTMSMFLSLLHVFVWWLIGTRYTNFLIVMIVVEWEKASENEKDTEMK